MPTEPYDVEITTQATKDVVELRSYLLRAIKAILALETQPLKGHTLAGSLSGVRSLEYSLPGGAYRAAYVIDHQQRRCIVFAVGPHENFYTLAERRHAALLASAKDRESKRSR